MKRQITLRFGDEEFSVIAYREGDTIVVERDEDRYEVKLVSESFLIPVADSTAPQPSATKQRSARTAPAAPAAPTKKAAPAPAASGPGTIVSPMVGVVKEVLVDSGAAVNEGDRVIIMEAMKMDIDVVSHVSGTVAEVAVSPGENVTEGQQLMRISSGGEA